MRAILVPLGGEAYDRLAPAAAYRVAGPFGRERILGGVTRPALEHGDMPLLIAN